MVVHGVAVFFAVCTAQGARPRLAPVSLRVVSAAGGFVDPIEPLRLQWRLDCTGQNVLCRGMQQTVSVRIPAVAVAFPHRHRMELSIP